MTQRQLRVIGTAIVVAPLLAFPLISVAGSSPRFPTRDDCARAAHAGTEELEVVYGRLDDPVAADALLAELTRVGFVGADVEFDACGRWKVSYDAIDTFAQGEALVEQVRRAGFDARVEVEG